MLCSPGAVFLLDTISPGLGAWLRLGSLNLLNHLGCCFGLSCLHWAICFLDLLGSHGGASQGGGKPLCGSRRAGWACP